MNKKLLLPFLALAVIPVLVFGVSQPSADEFGKQFAKEYQGMTIGVTTLEEAITEQEEINRASLVVEGTILNAKPYWVKINDHSYPEIFTDYTVQVDDVIKGAHKKVITVTIGGGELDGVKTATDSHELAKGDRVIMILGQDITTIFRDSYVPISISKSTYVIGDDDIAENKQSDRTDKKDKVKERLTKLVAES
jgi:hypothetical protein